MTTIAEYINSFLEETLFGTFSNEWLAAHSTLIYGIATLVLCAAALAAAIWLAVSIVRFFARLIDLRR